MVEHFIPTSKQEALAILAKGNVQILAGGTDLMVQCRSKSEMPIAFTKNILYTSFLDELKYIKQEDNNLIIGAGMTLNDVLNHPLCPPLLKELLTQMASPAIRNQATFAGNIGNASPAGDSLVYFYFMDALITLESTEGKREVEISKLITGVRRKAMSDNEMITEIRFPLHPFSQTRLVKVGGRKADAISKVSFIGGITLDGDVITDLRLAFGAVSPTVVRSREIERKYIGKTKSEIKTMIGEIQQDYLPLIQPITDQRSNKQYRNQVCGNLIRDFILSIQ